MTQHRIEERREFGPSVLWESQPIVGGRDRRAHNQRARAWRFMGAGLALFWIGVGALIARMAGG